MRLEIRVQPGAKAESVGGTYGGALVVRVCQPAEKGRATTAALRAVARALGTRGHDVRLVSGGTSRRKLLEIETSAQDHDAIARRIGELRQAGGGEGRGTHGGQLERP